MKTKAKYARLLSLGKRKAVLLPADVRFEGKRVLVRGSGKGLLIEAVSKPMFRDTKAWFAAMVACPMSPDFLQDIRD